jgi:hypothetical protein
VFAGSGGSVEMSMVDGRVLMHDRELVTLDEERILNRATTTAFRIVREADLDHLIRRASWQPPCCRTPE